MRRLYRDEQLIRKVEESAPRDSLENQCNHAFEKLWLGHVTPCQSNATAPIRMCIVIKKRAEKNNSAALAWLPSLLKQN